MAKINCSTCDDKHEEGLDCISHLKGKCAYFARQLEKCQEESAGIKKLYKQLREDGHLVH